MKYTLISLSGPDRSDFLQGQMTQDIDALRDGISLPSAWCNPKGRVLVTCHLVGMQERLLMAVPTASIEATLKRLHMYRLRAKVDIETEPEVRFCAIAGDHATQLAAAIGMPANVDRWAAKGLSCARLAGADTALEVFASAEDLHKAGLEPGQALDDDAWAERRAGAGLVDIDAGNGEKFTPHMLNLDRTGAVSFSKGCYTGQEIVARTEHLGKVKRRVNLYRCSGGTLHAGDRAEHDGKEIGEVVNAAGDLALVVVPVQIFDATLTVGGIRLLPRPLPYAIEADDNA